MRTATAGVYHEGQVSSCSSCPQHLQGLPTVEMRLLASTQVCNNAVQAGGDLQPWQGAWSILQSSDLFAKIKHLTATRSHSEVVNASVWSGSPHSSGAVEKMLRRAQRRGCSLVGKQEVWFRDLALFSDGELPNLAIKQPAASFPKQSVVTPGHTMSPHLNNSLSPFFKVLGKHKKKTATKALSRDDVSQKLIFVKTLLRPLF